jgi:hypothetical protein
MQIQFTVTGLDQLIENLQARGEAAVASLGTSLYEEAERIMADSKANYVPVDLGVLRNSGTVFPPVQSGNETSVKMAYGGAAAAYVVAVHEHLGDEPHDPRSWKIAMARGHAIHFTVGGPKFLELPFNAALRGMAGRIASGVRWAA